MADLGLEHRLQTCKASLLIASPGREGAVIWLSSQRGEDVDSESEHRMFLEDPGGLRNPIHFPDLICACRHFRVFRTVRPFDIALAATETQSSRDPNVELQTVATIPSF